MRVPPVRERREDIGALANALLAGFDHVPQLALQHKAIEIIAQLELPGNVRELRNLLVRALVFGADLYSVQTLAPPQSAPPQMPPAGN